jgi:type I restriction enzyme S subunit
MKPWPIVRLGEVLTHYTNYIEAPEAREYRKLSVKLYGKGVVLDAPTDGAMLKMKRHQLANAGQVILSEIWGKKGAIGFVPPEGDGALCTSHFFLFDIREDKLDRRWLKAIFDANFLQEQLDAEAKGTTGYAAVRPKILLACEIPLPPLAEQRRVVARIEALAAQIHEARTLRHQAAEEAEALRSAGRNTFFVSVAKDFGSSRLEELSSRVTKGESPEWQGFTYQDSGPLFIRSENVLWGSLNPRNAVHIPQAFHEKLSRCQLRKDDVLINLVGASIGRACAVPGDLGDANVNQAVGVISPDKEKLVPDFLVHFLLSPIAQDTIHGGKVETARPNISLGDIRDLEIPTPPLPEQRRIVAELDALQAEVDALKRLQAETAAELDALLPAILDRAFKGEL